jgi:hypothetical protein
LTLPGPSAPWLIDDHNGDHDLVRQSLHVEANRGQSRSDREYRRMASTGHCLGASVTVSRASTPGGGGQPYSSTESGWGLPSVLRRYSCWRTYAVRPAHRRQRQERRRAFSAATASRRAFLSCVDLCDARRQLLTVTCRGWSPRGRPGHCHAESESLPVRCRLTRFSLRTPPGQWQRSRQP